MGILYSWLFDFYSLQYTNLGVMNSELDLLTLHTS